MDITELTSRDNPLFKTIRLVASQSRRAPKSVVLAEGIRTLEEVCNSRCVVDCALISEGFGNQPRERALIDHWNAAGVRLCRARESLIKTVSGVQSFQGALALARLPAITLEAVELRADPLILGICG